MRNITQLSERLSDLHDLLDVVEVMMENPSHSKQEKQNSRTIAQALSFGIEQIEWVLGLREYTLVDAWKPQ